MGDRPQIIAADAQVGSPAGWNQLQCSNQCLRKRCIVMHSCLVFFGDAEASVSAKYDQLQCCVQCAREGYVVGDSPWIAAGDGGSVAFDTASGELECSL